MHRVREAHLEELGDHEYENCQLCLTVGVDYGLEAHEGRVGAVELQRHKEDTFVVVPNDHDDDGEVAHLRHYEHHPEPPEEEVVGEESA